MNKTIKIESFNPYESIFPNRKVITLDTLILIKTLRQNGYEVQILPLNNRPVHYIFRKGLTEFLSDPINVSLVGIPISILTNLLSNYIQKTLEKPTKKRLNPDKNVIIINDNSTNVFYNYSGEIISKKDINIRSKSIEEIQIKFKKEFEKKTPKKNLPVPIFYEHRPEIVGWCRIQMDSKGLLIEEGRIISKKIKQKIEKGKIKGLSVTGIATKTHCSVCEEDFVTCIHLGDNVINTIQKADFVEVSLVKTPINAECLLNLT